ncbi:MAG: lysophospholipid acyltransferase family protein [Pyrinomonadaceae bacterium]
MKNLRAIIRFLAMCGVMVGSYSCWVLGQPFVFAFPSVARRWRKLNFGGWARASAAILGMRVNVRNAPPTAPFLLVSNHLSYVDIIVLESLVDCAFIAKSELASWPILGFISRTLNTIFIDRSRKRDILQAMERADRALARGLGVVLFAEGTSTQGKTVSPFKSSLLEIAARRSTPVHYVTLSYRSPADEPAADQTVSWWGDMTFFGHLFQLLQLPRFEANVVFGPKPIIADDRHVLAEKLWSAVSSQLKVSRLETTAKKIQLDRMPAAVKSG